MILLMSAGGRPSFAELALLSRRGRRDAIEAIYRAGSGHPGSALSTMDVLVALYHGGLLRHDPKKPDWDERDYFLLSNGHAAPGLYAVLAHRGYFPVADLVTGLRKLGTGFQGHPKRGMLPGVEISSGSLGQGLGLGIGLAQSLRLRGKKNRVVVLMSDGEQEEGSTWEAVMFGAKLKPPNLLAIVDKNGMQIDGPTKDVMPSLDPLGAKYQAFGWDVLEVDGHNVEQLLAEIPAGFENGARGRPTVIISHTVRGHGVSFMENSPKWHAGKITPEQFAQAERELVGNPNTEIRNPQHIRNL